MYAWVLCPAGSAWPGMQIPVWDGLNDTTQGCGRGASQSAQRGGKDPPCMGSEGTLQGGFQGISPSIAAIPSGVESSKFLEAIATSGVEASRHTRERNALSSRTGLPVRSTDLRAARHGG